jgi:hypothetical protein
LDSENERANGVPRYFLGSFLTGRLKLLHFPSVAGAQKLG